MQLIVLIPIYHDWIPASHLIREIDNLTTNEDVHVVIVNDSAETYNNELDSCRVGLNKISKVSVLNWKINVGNQCSIALGIKYILNELSFDAAIIMDGDGEDNVQDIPRLINEYKKFDGKKMVVAKRGQRSESLVFRICYRVYRFIFKFLTEHEIRWGHYSIIPRVELARISAIPELELHFPASLLKHKIVVTEILSHRTKRIAGKPKTNFVFLITHAFRSFAIFFNVIMVRFLKAGIFAIVMGILASIFLDKGKIIVFGILILLGLFLNIIAFFITMIKTQYLLNSTSDHKKYVNDFKTVYVKS
ncbi:MAG: hypothetical protein U0T83_02235 [Bacteriovoracaceae bacterium]